MNRQELVEFRTWLRKERRTKLGDPLLPETIKQYIYFVKDAPSASGLNEKETLEVLQHYIDSRKGIVVQAACRNYMEFLGYERVVCRKLKKKNPQRTALKSIQLLQSKLMTRAEVRRLIDSDLPLMHRLAISLLYDTACRRKELLGIRLMDINFKDLSAVVTGKGDKKRTVYFQETSKKLLLEHIANERMEKDAYIIRFRTQNGKPCKNQGQALWKMVKKAANRILNRHNIHPHCFRHTALSHLSDRGADVLGIRDIAGHSDVGTTQIYIKTSKARAEKTYKKYSVDIMQED